MQMRNPQNLAMRRAIARLETWGECRVVAPTERKVQHDVARCLIDKDASDGIDGVTEAQVDQHHEGMTHEAAMEGVEVQWALKAESTGQTNVSARAKSSMPGLPRGKVGE